MADRNEALLSSSDWPNMLEESIDMLQGSILIYALADIRQLARKGMLAGDAEAIKKITTTPVSADDIIQVVNENASTLQETFGEESVSCYLSSLEHIRESIRRQSVSPDGEAVFVSAKVVVFDDENSDSELVYGIFINSARKRVTVAFRGSVTATDFVTDANSYMSNIPNPVASERGQAKTLGIHNGFYEYLFGKKKESSDSKCDAIMKHVRALMEANPQYSLYTTGHSLGGALSTLFAFEAAADDQILKPVTCINIASPKVGNLAFRRAFQNLERKKHIRCLRIANHKDLVTLMPDRGSFSLAYIACCQQGVYRHVGAQLKLYANGTSETTCPHDGDGYCGIFLRDCKKLVGHSFAVVGSLALCCCYQDFLKCHSCKEYMSRLEKVSGDANDV